MAESSDFDLAQRSRQGDTEAFAELVRRYQVSVFNVCYRLLGERRSAEDLAQEAFIRAYLHLDSYQPERPFGPWMRRVAANLCINQLKLNQFESIPLEEEDDVRLRADGNDTEEIYEQIETSRDLAAAIRALRPQQRAVIELSHFQGLSYTEIASALDLPLSDVKSHLFRARKRLAEILKYERS